MKLHCPCGSWDRFCRRTAWAAPAFTGMANTGAFYRRTSWLEVTTLSDMGPARFLTAMTIQDWGVTYDELEPYYDKFERLCGISGKAGNIKGSIQNGGNPFEGARSRDYPNPPMEMTYGPTLFAEAARQVGHKPFACASANMSRAYTNPLGVTLGQCSYCGFCEKYGCGNYSKASPQTTILPVLMRKPNFELRTGSEVIRINHDKNQQACHWRHLCNRARRGIRAARRDRNYERVYTP